MTTYIVVRLRTGEELKFRGNGFNVKDDNTIDIFRVVNGNRLSFACINPNAWDAVELFENTPEQ